MEWIVDADKISRQTKGQEKGKEEEWGPGAFHINK